MKAIIMEQIENSSVGAFEKEGQGARGVEGWRDVLIKKWRSER